MDPQPEGTLDVFIWSVESLVSTTQDLIQPTPTSLTEAIFDTLSSVDTSELNPDSTTERKPPVYSHNILAGETMDTGTEWTPSHNGSRHDPLGLKITEFGQAKTHIEDPPRPEPSATNLQTPSVLPSAAPSDSSRSLDASLSTPTETTPRPVGTFLGPEDTANPRMICVPVSTLPTQRANVDGEGIAVIIVSVVSCFLLLALAWAIDWLIKRHFLKQGLIDEEKQRDTPDRRSIASEASELTSTAASTLTISTTTATAPTSYH